MNIKATQSTAVIAGAWTVFGLVPFEMWMDNQLAQSALSNNLLWLLAFVTFLGLPGYFLVIGSDNEPLSRTWFLGTDERVRYGVIAKRMFIWFIFAGAFGMPWSLLLGALFTK
ncbi:hypothetical protein LHU53_19460 [Rhodoferax sp. U2-2l]|uniref:hypothetical protein n=1 Tax=Rhodoferax sp. U2-2l TaxID=2884000 RepID=UPI001D0A5262|nr:hypothetical protein [Rhodoferax sp. U2-2l]MCB8749071.1 hypothetical protein [Rhodoferax sp. U2-2l]